MTRLMPGKVYDPRGMGMDRYLYTPVNDGIDQNRGTSGAFARQGAELYLYRTIQVEKILWDVRNNGTYTLRFTTTRTGTTVVKIITASKVVTAGADVEFLPDGGPIILTPGTYNIQLTLDSGTATWWDRSDGKYVGSVFAMSGMAYDGSGYSYGIPCRFVGQMISTPAANWV